MRVSILGNGLTSLALAQMLANEGIRVDIFSNKRITRYKKIQTLGISKTNIDFFNKNILSIKKLLWNINKIEIFTENLHDEKVIDFEDYDKNLFFIVRNSDLYKTLNENLKRNKLVKFKEKINSFNSIREDYKLIFNCDHNHPISKKFFYKKLDKDYNSLAYVATFKHKKLSDNHLASQIFTKQGPLAFLPISSTETSVVYSVKGKKKVNLEELINKYNKKYKILSISDFFCFGLKSSNLRSYYYQNIIAFGDMLHRLHPLAGQGFNMTIRDIKEIYKLINFKKKHGLDLDISIVKDFEKNTKNKNFLFSNGIDLIYEFFSFESKFKNKKLSKFIQFLGKNKPMNKFFKSFADKGLNI